MPTPTTAQPNTAGATLTYNGGSASLPLVNGR